MPLLSNYTIYDRDFTLKWQLGTNLKIEHYNVLLIVLVRRQPGTGEVESAGRAKDFPIRYGELIGWEARFALHINVFHIAGNVLFIE